MNKEYEVVIVGGGPAGLSAGLYASRAGLGSLLIEKGLVGGQITNAERVENYTGIFAAGDICYNSARQVITAAGDGATAAICTKKFITG